MTAPRQLSANGEYGFPIGVAVGRVRVFVNGDMLRNVIAYDMDESWVEVVPHDDKGKLIRVGDAWQIVRHHGTIRVDLP